MKDLTKVEIELLINALKLQLKLMSDYGLIAYATEHKELLAKLEALDNQEQ